MKVKFGVMLPVMVPSGSTPRSPYHALQHGYTRLDTVVVRDAALEAERLGYDSVWVSDHFSRAACRERLECWTTMSWLAHLTKRVRIGSMVLCNLYRHPGLLAKMAATLDVLSGGRLEFGIGACWSEDECSDYGIDWPENATRVRMLREAVVAMKRLWTQETTTFHGKHYHITDAYLEPKPLQKPHPPIMIGGSGEQLTLRLVARHADRSNFGGTPENVKRKIQVLRGHCEEIGRDPDSIEKTSNVAVVIAPTRDEYLEDMRRRFAADGAYGEFEDWLAKMEASYLAGTPEECVEQLINYTGLGVTHFIIRFGDIPSLDGLRLFAEEIIPKLN
jgi:F420-dependent oxidoreductase-like protein